MRESPELPTLQPRAALLRRRVLREGWLLVLIGTVVPVLAVLGAMRAYPLRNTDPRAAYPLILVGCAVFVVRLALYVG